MLSAEASREGEEKEEGVLNALEGSMTGGADGGGGGGGRDVSGNGGGGRCSRGSGDSGGGAGGGIGGRGGRDVPEGGVLDFSGSDNSRGHDWTGRTLGEGLENDRHREGSGVIQETTSEKNDQGNDPENGPKNISKNDLENDSGNSPEVEDCVGHEMRVEEPLRLLSQRQQPSTARRRRRRRVVVVLAYQWRSERTGRALLRELGRAFNVREIPPEV